MFNLLCLLFVGTSALPSGTCGSKAKYKCIGSGKQQCFWTGFQCVEPGDVRAIMASPTADVLCRENDKQFKGTSLRKFKLDGAKTCMEECDLEDECTYWTYSGEECQLLSEQSEVIDQKGAISGPKKCNGVGATKYCTIIGYTKYTADDDLFKETVVLTMDGCTDLCRSSHEDDCQHVVLHLEKDGRLKCLQLKKKPKQHRGLNKDSNYLSADRKCGLKNDAEHEEDGINPNFDKKLGMLVNLAVPNKDMEQHLREIGNHRGMMLFDSTNESCYKVTEHPGGREGHRKEESKNMTEISESASNTIGVSAGYGPVKVSAETTFGNTEHKSGSVYQRITEGWSYQRTRIIKEKCLTDHGFRDHVLENMKLSLLKMKKLKMPNKPTDTSEWKNYWLHFQNFANDFGTHMVTEVNDGMRVLRIEKRSSHSLTTGNNFEFKGGIEVGSPGGPSVGASAGHMQEGTDSSSDDKKLIKYMQIGTPPDINIDWDDIAGSLNRADPTNEIPVVSEVKQPLWALLAPLEGFKELRTIIKRFAYWAEYVYTNNGIKKPRCQCENNNRCIGKPRKKKCQVKMAPIIQIPRKANGSTGGGVMEELLPDIFVGSMCGDEEEDYSVAGDTYFSVYACNDCSSSHNDDEKNGTKTEKCLTDVTGGENWREKNCQWQKTKMFAKNTNYCADEPRYFDAMNLCCKRECGFCNIWA